MRRFNVLTKRLIACLDVHAGRVVKGVNFTGLRDAGDPAELAARYNREGIDELVVLDISATLEGRRATLATVTAVSRTLFIPLTVGGGIRSLDDAKAVVDAGADKIAINSAALADPSCITELARRYGSQAVVVAIDARRVVDIDARRVDDTGPRRSGDRFEVLSRSATVTARPDVVAWARDAEARGAGEILLTSIDRDGTRAGFDCDLTAMVSSAVQIPVIASGGAGEPAHFAEIFERGRADAALAASVFHRAEQRVGDLKHFLAARGIPMRLSW